MRLKFVFAGLTISISYVTNNHSNHFIHVNTKLYLFLWWEFHRSSQQNYSAMNIICHFTERRSLSLIRGFCGANFRMNSIKQVGARAELWKHVMFPTIDDPTYVEVGLVSWRGGLMFRPTHVIITEDGICNVTFHAYYSLAFLTE
jgi:hypothetical protein